MRPEQFHSVFDVLPFTGTVTLTAVAGAETSDTISVPGVAPGDIVLGAIVEDTESGVLGWDVNAADLVEVTLVNATASTITIPAATVAQGVVLRMKEFA